MSYQYWNEFVDKWRSLPSSEYSNPNPKSIYQHILGWENPNLGHIRLMSNANIQNDFSLQYLPEPWWGNDGSDELHSVVINYNPGGGWDPQHYLQSSLLYKSGNYQRFVGAEVNKFLSGKDYFKGTSTWHNKKRAIPIFDALRSIGFNTKKFHLQNHLSIELIPWHTQNISHIGKYIKPKAKQHKDNLQALFNYSITFAANESLRIPKKNVLHSKVILRLSGNRTKNLLKKLKEANICQSRNEKEGKSKSQNGSYFSFEIDHFPNVQFWSIWGARSRNQFPPDVDLKEIFKLM